MNGDNSTISGTVTDASDGSYSMPFDPTFDNGTPPRRRLCLAVQGQEETASTTTEAVVTFRLAGYVTYIANTESGAPLQSLDATLQRDRA